jgi:hypothetical protein
MDMWANLLAPLISSAFAAGIAAWLTRLWIKTRLEEAVRHEYDAKLETLRDRLRIDTESRLEVTRVQLRAEADAAQAKLQAHLNTALEQRRIEYEVLFRVREPALKDLYAKLLDALEISEEALGNPQKAQDAKTALVALYIDMERVAVYFPRAFHDRWSQSILALHNALVKLSAALMAPTLGLTTDMERLTRATDAAFDAAKEIKGPLRDEIRRLLGVREE